jgi:hypothetical protein
MISDFVSVFPAEASYKVARRYATGYAPDYALGYRLCPGLCPGPGGLLVCPGGLRVLVT